MSAILQGLKLGIGVAAGFVLCMFLVRLSVSLWAIFDAWQFSRAGFLYNSNQKVWYTRDPDNDEWIYWDEIDRKVLRACDGDYKAEPSPESRRQCLKTGRRYWRAVERELAKAEKAGKEGL